ncbi:MAG: SAM-dependent methyltransferase, partial [Thermacetogeniaceae bacterium]
MRREGDGRPGRGRLAVVGIGPGDPAHLSARALEVLREAEVVIGYRPYLKLLADVLAPGQAVEGSGMRQEVLRARRAVELALGGKRVVVVSSGDAGIYGMAGIVLEVLLETGEHGRVEFEVVPGITAASAA